MKKVYALILCGLLMLTTVGCGTIKGLGEDISTVGRWLIKGSDTATTANTK